MKYIITTTEWAKIEDALMQAEIPFHVYFDSHVNEAMDSVTYDKCIRIEPFVIQVRKEIK